MTEKEIPRGITGNRSRNWWEKSGIQYPKKGNRKEVFEKHPKRRGGSPSKQDSHENRNRVHQHYYDSQFSRRRVESGTMSDENIKNRKKEKEKRVQIKSVKTHMNNRSNDVPTTCRNTGTHDGGTLQGLKARVAAKMFKLDNVTCHDLKGSSKNPFGVREGNLKLLKETLLREEEEFLAASQGRASGIVGDSTKDHHFLHQQLEDVRRRQELRIVDCDEDEYSLSEFRHRSLRDQQQRHGDSCSQDLQHIQSIFGHSVTNDSNGPIQNKKSCGADSVTQPSKTPNASLAISPVQPTVVRESGPNRNWRARHTKATQAQEPSKS